MNPVIDMRGQRFGRLYVEMRYISLKKLNAAYWVCVCDCGNTVNVAGISLRTGSTKSCGCLKKETGRLLLSTHGKSGSCTYESWKNMRRRCFDRTNESYKYYGGRGITVCERWNDYVNFLVDMGERPPKLTLDRINNNGNYEPGNCRWASRVEQARNTRATVLTKEQAEQIRERVKYGERQVDVAKDFFVSRYVVWGIMHGLVWAAL